MNEIGTRCTLQCIMGLTVCTIAIDHDITTLCTNKLAKVICPNV